MRRAASSWAAFPTACSAWPTRWPGECAGNARQAWSGCLAYNQHSEPPAFATGAERLRPAHARASSAAATRHEQLLELWPKKCRNLGFYEYFSVWLWDFDRLPGGNGGEPEAHPRLIRRYREAGATSIDCRERQQLGRSRPGLLRRQPADVEPRRRRGRACWPISTRRPSAPPPPAMRRYYERVGGRERAARQPRPGGRGLARRGGGGAAGQGPARRAGPARPAQALPALRAPAVADRPRARTRPSRRISALAALTLVYRTRYEYMNHWAAMRSTWADAWRKEFDEPAWQFNDRSPKAVDRRDARQPRGDRAAGSARAWTIFSPRRSRK